MDDRAASPEDLQRENRLLSRKLARMDTNVRQMEEMQDSTSKLLSSLTARRPSPTATTR